MESDIRRMLDEAAGPPATVTDVGSIIARGRRRRRSSRMAAVLLSVALVAFAGVGAGLVRDLFRTERAPAGGGISRPPDTGGLVLAASQAGDRESALYLMDGDGGDRNLLLDEPVGGEMAPAWSPDRTLLAFAMNVAPGDDPDTVDTNMEIFVVRSDGTSLQRLTYHPGLDTNPAWSPDGSRIAFTRWPEGPASEGGDRVAIWAMSSDGSDLERLTLGPGLADHAAWSPDGDHIAFSRYVISRDAYVIFTMEAHAEEVRRFHTVTEAPYGVSSTSPSWSPDGRRIAFVRDSDQNRLGDRDLYLVDSTGGNLERVTAEGGSYYDPTWSPDGASIAFIRGTQVSVISLDGRDLQTLASGFTRMSGIDWAD
jgi:Tol biopolymer transport system component